MGNCFVEAMKHDSNGTLTENGAYAYKSTNSSLVDLFGSIGSLRSRSVPEIEHLFSAAFAEDELLATKMAFYARNVRGGLGERDTARHIWRYLANAAPNIMRANLEYIPLFGRWDDLYSLLGTPVEKEVWALIQAQYESDVEAMKSKGSISLMAKWLKSANSKKPAYARLGMRTARALHMSDKAYRKNMAALRDYLNIVEVQMSKGAFDAIAFEGVSSRAMTLYRNAFAKRNPGGFQEYLDLLVKGETKINSSTLYPYDILEGYNVSNNWNRCLSCGDFNVVLEEQWKALPNYVEGENNVLVMADTSGSMGGRPLLTSVGLALYFAERNKGAFHNTFMTFSSHPEFVTVKGKTLRDKLSGIEVINSNTNIEAAFRKILDVAIQNHVPQSDMPKTLVIVSDMEFDYAQSSYGCDNRAYHDIMVKMYERAGYELPTIIFWNVDSRHDTFHVSSDKPGVQLASGQSPSTFKSILANIGKNPYEAMVSTLNAEMYSMITV